MVYLMLLTVHGAHLESIVLKEKLREIVILDSGVIGVLHQQETKVNTVNLVIIVLLVLNTQQDVHMEPTVEFWVLLIQVIVFHVLLVTIALKMTLS